MMMTMSVPIPMYMGRVVPVRPIRHASARCDQWSATRPSGGSIGRPASCHASMPPAIDTAS